MRHFLIYALAAALLFSMVGRFAAAETGVAADTPAAVPMAVMAKSAEVDGEEPEAVPEVVLTGLLQTNLDCMDDMYFKNAFLENLGEGFSVHSLATADTGTDQATMFRKMIDKGYKLIVVELYDRAMADEYIALAQENGVILIFTGVQPSEEQMSRMSDLYYVGFSSGNAMRELADAIAMGWSNNQENLDLKPDGKLIYGVFTADDYADNGNEATLERYLTNAGIESEMGLNPITQAFSFDLKKEVDNILYAGGEMIICDNSSYARQISDYLRDPDEFPERLQKTRIFLTTADEAAQKMVEEGTAMFATGANGGDMGVTVAKLARVLAQGEKPTKENVGIAPDQTKRIYVTNRTLVADLLKERAPVEETEE